MCMSCGCAEPDERHNEGDITSADLQRAAQNAGIDAEKAADNIHAAARKMRGEGSTGQA